MNARVYVPVAVMAAAVAWGFDNSEVLSAFRVDHVVAHAEEWILLSREEQKPKRETAFAQDPVNRVYFREGDLIDDGNLVAKVDKTHRTVILQKGDVTTTLRVGPPGIQTSLWAILISTETNTVWTVKVGDRIMKDWTITRIDSNDVVVTSNSTGQVFVIPPTKKESQQPASASPIPQGR